MPETTGASAVDVVRDLVLAWNSHDIDRICEFIDDDFENWQLPLPTVRGLAGYRRHVEHWFAAYPDLRLEILTVFGAGDLVCLETRATGTPSGDFFGAAASGCSRDRENRALDVLELRDGKVWRERGYWDFSLWTGQPRPPSTVTAGLYAPRRHEVLWSTIRPTLKRNTLLVYIEYISRRPGVGVEAFHTVAGRGQTGWAGDYPDDVMIANLGRSWRLGPEPEYLCVWWTANQGLDRIDDWERVFRGSDAEAFEEPFRLAARIDRAGCYEPLIEPVVGTSERYYLEFVDFADDATHDDVRAAYQQRQAHHPDLTLNLLADRIGRLGPDPRALALWSLPAWAALDGVARDLDQADGPVRLVTAGGYSQMGQETL